MKIDLHTHILPREWPDLDKKYGYPGFIRLEHCDACSARMMKGDRVFREIKSNTWDPARRLEDMDRTGVSMQALSTNEKMLVHAPIPIANVSTATNVKPGDFRSWRRA